MSVQIFTKTEFDAVMKKYNAEYIGVILGEHSYIIPLSGDVKVLVRSSISENGFSRETGEDSIRLNIVQIMQNPRRLHFWTKKLDKWVTRVKGWENRLDSAIEIVKNWYNICQCGQIMYVFKCKNGGKNHGRIFAKCDCGRGWKWLSD